MVRTVPGRGTFVSGAASPGDTSASGAQRDGGHLAVELADQQPGPRRRTGHWSSHALGQR
jgi:hypothetical protein